MPNKPRVSREEFERVAVPMLNEGATQEEIAQAVAEKYGVPKYTRQRTNVLIQLMGYRRRNAYTKERE